MYSKKFAVIIVVIYRELKYLFGRFLESSSKK